MDPPRPLPPATRRLVVLVLLVGVVAVAAAASVAVGANPLSPLQVWWALVHPTGGEGDIVVNSLRLPRTALGLVVGLALGVAGALMQGHTRNPLADPGLLGVSDGAALGVVVAVFGFGVTTLDGYVWFAFAGALLASITVFLIGGIGTVSGAGRVGSGAGGGLGGASPVSLALAGIAVGALLKGITTTLALFDSRTLDAYRFWAVGSLAGRPPELVWQILPYVVAGLFAAAVNVRALNALTLGDDTARALGHRILLSRAVGIGAITLLSGSAVAAAGPLAFVGLVVPHVARTVTGPDHRWLVPYSGLLGAALLLVADVIGRVVARPGELLAGTALALIGAPCFIALVRRRRLVRI
jgi:iron complex transport system permease protein